MARLGSKGRIMPSWRWSMVVGRADRGEEFSLDTDGGVTKSRFLSRVLDVSSLDDIARLDNGGLNESLLSELFLTPLSSPPPSPPSLPLPLPPRPPPPLPPAPPPTPLLPPSPLHKGLGAGSLCTRSKDCQRGELVFAPSLPLALGVCLKATDGDDFVTDFLATSAILLVPGEVLFAPGVDLLAPGEVLFAPVEVLFAPGEVLFAPGEILFAPGEVLLAPTEVLFAPGAILLATAEVLLALDEVLLAPTEVLFAPGVVLLAPGVVLLLLAHIGGLIEDESFLCGL